MGLRQRLHYEYLHVLTMSTSFTRDVTASVFNGLSIATLYDWKHLLVLSHNRCVCTIVRTKQWFLHLARCFVEQPLGGTLGRCQVLSLGTLVGG